MRKDETFKKKLEADIALLQAELLRFTARGMGFTAEAKDRHDEHVEMLELKIDQINDNLSKLDNADEHLRKDLKDDLENSWRELRAAFQNAIETFKPEKCVADPHGNDDGPFPYGEGLGGRSAEKK